MKKLILWQTVFLTLGSLILAAISTPGAAASYAIGSVMVTFNLVSHFLVWTYLIDRKKLIAFAAIIVVFKYAILGAIIYQILGFTWVSPFWFCMGISTFLVSAVVFASSKEDYVV